MLSLQLVKSIAESHVIIGHIEGNGHRLLLAIEISYVELVGMIIHMRNLSGTKVVAFINLCLTLLLKGQALAEVSYVGKETEL